VYTEIEIQSWSAGYANSYESRTRGRNKIQKYFISSLNILFMLIKAEHELKCVCEQQPEDNI
jgi:hypothetical protein